MARRPRAEVSKPSKPSTDVGSDGTHHLNAKPASQVALPESAPDEDTLDKIANLLATQASKPEDFYRRDEAVAKVSGGRNGDTHFTSARVLKMDSLTDFSSLNRSPRPEHTGDTKRAVSMAWEEKSLSLNYSAKGDALVSMQTRPSRKIS